MNDQLNLQNTFLRCKTIVCRCLAVYLVYSGPHLDILVKSMMSYCVTDDRHDVYMFKLAESNAALHAGPGGANGPRSL